MAQALKDGSIAIIPTDTIYGIVASAWNKQSVERIYAIKKRAPEKPCIILIADAFAMKEFGVLERYIQEIAHNETPGPTSFIVPIERTDLAYLDRGTGTLAFRIPHTKELHELLKISGPLIAPSANPQGLHPATTTEEARGYFGADIEHYVDGGMLQANPSALIDVRSGERLR